MLNQHFAIQVISFMAVVQSGCGTYLTDEKFVPDFTNYNPLQGGDFVQITDVWQHFVKNEDLSASVADFLSENGECVRVVVFTGQDGPMEDVKISCNSPDPFFGVVHLYDKLWFFGTAFVKRLGKKGYGLNEYKNRFVVVRGNNEDVESCEKTWWIIDRECYLDCPQKSIGKSPHTVKMLEDEDCKEVISQQNIPPMLIYSPNGDVSKEKPTGDWTTLNAWDAVGAGIREYQDKSVCFRLLVLYSYGRPLDSMKVACGKLRGVTMTDRTFYYGRTVMVKVHDDPNTFTVFYHPRNGKTEIEPTSRNTWKTLPPVCIKKTFRLVKNNERYVKQRLSTVVEYVLGPDCKELVEGKIQGGSVDDEKINNLLNSLNKNENEVLASNVGADILSKMSDYKMAKTFNDFNLATELGVIIMLFKKSEDVKRVVVLAVGRGVILKGTTAEVQKNPGGVSEDNIPDSLVIRGDVLVYNRNLMLRKSSDTFIVLISTNGSGCTKNTYVIKPSGGKEETPTQAVDKSDPDCNDLLSGSRLMNPGAKTYNSATSLPKNV